MGEISLQQKMYSLARTPYHEVETAAEVQSVFRAQGIQEVQVFQGTRADHLLIDVVTNSEAAVFRSLEASAAALLHLGQKHPGRINAFELSMATAENESGGQFLLAAESARKLAAKELDVSTYFIDQVRF